jgi:energy-coupling factor transporter ATP-binding protein EcfA2
MERGITVILITHEMDIAEHGTRLVRFRDGRIQLDQAVTKRRLAADELKLLPPSDHDVLQAPAEAPEPAAATH